MNIADYAPFMGSVGGGFVAGALAGYAMKKVMKIAAVIAGFLYRSARIFAIPGNYSRRLG